MLGTRVADDVVWGLPPGTTTDVDRLLAEVGLDGLAERDTGGLSGGELQRLAVAAALAREPALLIADEVTSMVDQQGRDALLGVLSGLTERHRTALVHITHYNNEAESADRTINLSDVAGQHRDGRDRGRAGADARRWDTSPDAPVLEVAGVGHEYASGTPWAKTALRDISFTVHEGDGLLIHGGNGSGKSTLAWIMAGLTVPTTGTCLLDGRPTHDQVGAVALSFQAARLQLMRSRVDLEVASAAGFSPNDHDRVVAALAVVGLDAALAEAAHRPAQRRPDAPRGAGRAAGALAAGADPRRAAGGAGRRQPARSAAAARGSAARHGSDRGGHFARLRRAGGAVPAHPAPARRRAGTGVRRPPGACR